MLETVMALLAPLTAMEEAAPLPFPVLLNHFYLTVDSATYAAIETSRFLRTEFASFEQRTTVRKDRTYTGVYFYGTNTYFEFFDAGQERSRRLGDSGIAFGVEAPGASQALQTRLASELPMEAETITRQLGDVHIPWFLSSSPKDAPPASAIRTWIMEYDPRFLAQWHPEIGGGSQGIRRKEILQRYAATLDAVPQQPCLQDVVALTVAIDSAGAALLTKQCRVFGWAFRTEGQATLLGGPDIQLHLVPGSASDRGIRQVTLRVQRVPEGQAVFRFGPSSVLTFHENGTATWSF